MAIVRTTSKGSPKEAKNSRVSTKKATSGTAQQLSADDFKSTHANYTTPFSQAYGAWNNYLQSIMDSYTKYMKPFTEEGFSKSSYYIPFAKEYSDYIESFYKKFNFTPYSYGDSYTMDEAFCYYAYNMAGYDKEKVDVYTEDGFLVVSAEPSRNQKCTPFYSYTPQNYYRKYPLPYGCTNDIFAFMENGMLYIKVAYSLEKPHTLSPKKTYTVK